MAKPSISATGNQGENVMGDCDGTMQSITLGTIHTILFRISVANLRVNNLFEMERDDGTWHWRANLTDGELYFAFGDGATPEAALTAALEYRGPGSPGYTETRQAAPTKERMDDIFAEITSKQE